LCLSENKAHNVVEVAEMTLIFEKKHNLSPIEKIRQKFRRAVTPVFQEIKHGGKSLASP